MHGGGSGIGTAAIQLVKRAGGADLVTAGSDEKCAALPRARRRRRGRTTASGDFADAAREATGGRGVDVVLDSIGAPYLEKNLAALAIGGRLVADRPDGRRASARSISARCVAKRLSVDRLDAARAAGRREGGDRRGFLAASAPTLEAGALDPVVDRVLPLERAADAHRAMKASEHFGKIVLRVA